MLLGGDGCATRWPSGRGSVSDYGFAERCGFVVLGRLLVAVVFCWLFFRDRYVFRPVFYVYTARS